MHEIPTATERARGTLQATAQTWHESEQFWREHAQWWKHRDKVHYWDCREMEAHACKMRADALRKLAQLEG